MDLGETKTKQHKSKTTQKQKQKKSIDLCLESWISSSYLRSIMISVCSTSTTFHLLLLLRLPTTCSRHDISYSSSDIDYRLPTLYLCCFPLLAGVSPGLDWTLLDGIGFVMLIYLTVLGCLVILISSFFFFWIGLQDTISKRVLFIVLYYCILLYSIVLCCVMLRCVVLCCVALFFLFLFSSWGYSSSVLDKISMISCYPFSFFLYSCTEYDYQD